MVHECRCACIQLGRGSAQSVTITGAPIDIASKEEFSFEIKVPPLYRPDAEILIETLQAKNEGGEVTRTLSVARLGQREIKVGDVVVVLNDLYAEDPDKDKAIQKLCDLVGMAVVQAWADLSGSSDSNKRAAAKSMEIK